MLNVRLDFGSGLSGVGTVALTEPSSLLLVSGTIVLALLGVSPPLAEYVDLIILVVGAVLSHFEPWLAGIWVAPEVHLLAAADVILGDTVMGSPEAGAAAEVVFAGPVWTHREAMSEGSLDYLLDSAKDI